MPRLFIRHYTRFAALLWLAAVAAGGLWAQEITTALGVRSLSAEQAKEGRPVKVRGTVGFIEAPGTVFVQDATAGTFFRTKLPLGDLKEGDIVEVQGKSFPGLYLPGIETQSFQVVSQGEPPDCLPATYDDLAAGRFHYQCVAVEGTVRSVAALDENRAVMRLAVGSRVLEVRVERPPAGGESLVDASVRVRGLAAGAINEQRQLVQPYLKMSDWQHLTKLDSPSQAGTAQEVSAGSLMHFNTTGLSQHRVTVLGRVLAAFADGELFIRDGDTALAVRLTEPVRFLKPGELITVAGFPEMDRFSAMLADAVMMALDSAPSQPPAPVAVSLKELQKGAHDADLVTVGGTVTDVFRTADGVVLTLHGEDRSLRARLAGGDGVPVADIGSKARLTGICRVESTTGKGFNSRPETIALRLRSPEDVRVLETPSWWTAERLLSALGLLALIVFAGAVWIVMLRKRVKEQTEALSDRIKHEAALEERQRIAREFHDTLEQELAGLSIRMDAAATRPLEDKARSLLEASRSLVGRIQAEARNLVADLRDDSAGVEDLAVALQDLAHRQPSTGAIIKFDVEGPAPNLPPHVAHHLRMIAQEAVTNALKHAQARHITVKLSVTHECLYLSVSDDGRGFASPSDTEGKQGHFGCMGIRERCQRIGAAVRWQSRPGHGTTIEVTRPSLTLPHPDE